MVHDESRNIGNDLRDDDMTTIKYCGNIDTSDVSKCIDTLVDMLSKHTIDEKFFMRYNDNYPAYDKKIVWVNFNPIKRTENGYKFFGNFEGYSFAFHIETDEEPIINRLVNAIRNNTGWSMYYEKHKIDANQLQLF